MLTGNFAHRGARSLAPENTLAAIQKAWEIGADGVEVDVQALADGTLVIHHDSTLTRTTNVAHCFPDRIGESISSFTFEEIRSLDAGSWFVNQDPFGQIQAGTVSVVEQELMVGLQVPTLIEVLLFIKEKEWTINLELKHSKQVTVNFSPVSTLLNLLEELQIGPEQCAISSFHHPFLEEVMQYQPDLEVNALIGSKRSLKNRWGDFSYKIYNANESFIDKKQVKRAQEHGCTVNLYTVNDPVMMEEYLSWGVNCLITDYPQTLKEIMDGRDPA